MATEGLGSGQAESASLVGTDVPAKRRLVIVAEGDSWFDYPGLDILSALEELGHVVVDVAHHGDTLESMAYDVEQLDRFAQAIVDTREDHGSVDAILISGGGNDVAGNELASFLNHASSPNPGWNDRILSGAIDVRLRDALCCLIGAVQSCCPKTPVLTHGYDYPIPDGRGFGLLVPLQGPWLRPYFERKGYRSVDQNARALRALIDRFNDMQKVVTKVTGAVHVDLRDTLSATDWANELHPKERGFRRLAARLAAAIARNLEPA